jgi:hypothetical protein
MYPNVAKAVDWLKLNANRLKGTHRLPDFVTMDECELQQLNKDADDEELRNATSFWFIEKHDWSFFIDQLADHIPINACMEDCVR